MSSNKSKADSLEKRITRYLASPRWFLYFMLLPLGALSASILQTIEYSKGLYRYNGTNALSYFDQVLKPTLLSREFLLLLFGLSTTWIILYLLFGFSYPGRKWREFPKFLREQFIKTWRSFGKQIIISIIFFAFGSISSFEEALKQPLLEKLLLLVAAIFLYLLSKQPVWGSETTALARSAIVLIVSTIVVFSILLFYRVTIPAQSTFGDLWKDLLFLGVIYSILATYTTWIATRFSIMPNRKKRETDTLFILPIIFSAAFVMFAIYVVQIEAEYRDSPMFALRIADHFHVSSDKLDTNILENFRRFQNEHIIWRSMYSLFIGVIATTVAASLIKVGAYYAIIKSTVSHTDKTKK